MENTELIIYYHLVKMADLAKCKKDYENLLKELEELLPTMSASNAHYLCSHVVKRFEKSGRSKIIRDIRTLCNSFILKGIFD